MNPKYEFEITAHDGDVLEVKTTHPIYNDIAKEYALEQNEKFFRAKLTGKLTFVRDDYEFINSQSFETEFELRVLISYDNGSTFQQYWTGVFYKTDCEFDADSKNITVTPTVRDEYDSVLAGMEKEFNLIELAPEIQPIKIDKRPCVQIYTLGENTIGCFLSGMYWEQECEPTNDASYLRNTCHFTENYGKRNVKISGEMSPKLPDAFGGNIPQNDSLIQQYDNGKYRFKYFYTPPTSDVPSTGTWQIINIPTGQILWQTILPSGSAIQHPPYSLVLQPVADNVTGNVNINVTDTRIYSRMITDLSSVEGETTYPIASNDLATDMRNYHYCIGLNLSGYIYFYDGITETPTQYGKFDDTYYYEQPNPQTSVGPTFPISRSQWRENSIWFRYEAYNSQYWIVEKKARKEFTLKDANPIWSVISVLLSKIAPDIVHKGTAEYSEFLYGTNPITQRDYELYITQKTNLLKSEYDEPAKNAPITLKMITNMLRDCFRCYWFVDSAENGDLRFRIEHISYFQNGGTYTGNRIVGLDLTQLKNPRNTKSLAFGTAQFKFEKTDMPERYQFGWQDEVTEVFAGKPIDVRSRFVKVGQIEEISISNFVSDIDLMLLNPASFSEDGFALLSAPQKNVLEGPISPVETELYFKIYSIEVGELIDSYELLFTTDTQVDLLDASEQPTRTFQPGTHQVITQLPEYTDTINFAFDAVSYPYNITVYLVKDKFKKLEYLYERYSMGAGDETGLKWQNGPVAFKELQRFYMYDMPASWVTIDNVRQNVQRVRKTKTQNLKFPALRDPDVTKLVKTTLGDGEIQKLTINLPNRNVNATLLYDTEQ